MSWFRSQSVRVVRLIHGGPKERIDLNQAARPALVGHFRRGCVNGVTVAAARPRRAGGRIMVIALLRWPSRTDPKIIPVVAVRAATGPGRGFREEKVAPAPSNARTGSGTGAVRGLRPGTRRKSGLTGPPHSVRHRPRRKRANRIGRAGAVRSASSGTLGRGGDRRDPVNVGTGRAEQGHRMARPVPPRNYAPETRKGRLVSALPAARSGTGPVDNARTGSEGPVPSGAHVAMRSGYSVIRRRPAGGHRAPPP